MIDPATNPYQPAANVQDDRARLSFDGIIDESDYARLLPKHDFESILLRILIALLTLTTVGISGILIAVTITRGWDPGIIPAGVLMSVLVAGVFLAYRWAKPIQRAKRTLKRNPDLLSIARGELLDQGIAFHDGERQHWFGPQHLQATPVTSNGLRVRVDANPSRYLALTSRMFDGYNFEVAKRLKQNWKDAAAGATDPTIPAGIEAWRQLNPMPQDAVAFAGPVTLVQPMRTANVRQAAIINSALAAILLAMGLLAKGHINDWIVYGLLIYGFVSIFISLQTWWNFFRGKIVQNWNQCGWLSPTELAIVMASRGVRIRVGEVAHLHTDDHVITLTLRNGGAHYIFREHVATDDEWQRITDICHQAIAPREASIS